MRHTHRIAALGLLLLLLLLAGTASAAGIIQIETAKTTAAAGEEITLYLNLSGADSMTSCQLDLSVTGPRGTLTLTDGTLGGSYTLNAGTGTIVWTTTPVTGGRTAGTIAVVRYTPGSAGTAVFQVTPYEITERATPDDNVKDNYAIRGASVTVTGGKSIYLDLPATPATVGQPISVPVRISGAENLTHCSLTLTTDPALAPLFSITPGDLTASGYTIGSFDSSGVLSLNWISTTPDRRSNAAIVTLTITPSSVGNIPLGITLTGITEKTPPVENTDPATYTVTGGPIPVAGSAVVSVVNPRAVPLHKQTLLPVNITGIGSGGLKLITVQVTTNASGGNGVITLTKGTDSFPGTEIIVQPTAENGYTGRITLMYTTPAQTSGTLFSVGVTPDTTGDIPVRLAITQAEERGGEDNIDVTGRYSAGDTIIKTSYLNILSNNTVPPFTTGDGLWSAVTPSRIVYNASPEERNMAPPQITWGGKSVPVNETLIVEQTSDGTTWSDVFRGTPTLDAAGNVTIPAATAADAVELRITFEGRRLGDVDGSDRINLRDVILLSRYQCRIIPLDDHTLFYGDIDGNGRVNLRDVILLSRYQSRILNEHYSS